LVHRSVALDRARLGLCLLDSVQLVRSVLGGLGGLVARLLSEALGRRALAYRPFPGLFALVLGPLLLAGASSRRAHASSSSSDAAASVCAVCASLSAAPGWRGVSSSSSSGGGASAGAAPPSSSPSCACRASGTVISGSALPSSSMASLGFR